MKKISYWCILIFLATVSVIPSYCMDESDDDETPWCEAYAEFPNSERALVVPAAQAPEDQHFVVGQTAFLRQQLDRFKQNIGALLPDWQPAPETIRGSIERIQQHHGALQRYCQILQGFVNERAREQECEGKSAAVCYEVSALFDLIAQKVDTLNGKLEALTCAEAPDHALSSVHIASVEKELALQDAHVVGSRIVETLVKFFGLVSNDEAAYRLCPGVNVPKLVFEKLLKKPLEIDRILRESHAKWYGETGLAARYHCSFGPVLDSACQILQERYHAGDQLRETIRGLEREIAEMEFAIYNFRRLEQKESEVGAIAGKGELERKRDADRARLMQVYHGQLGLNLHDTVCDPPTTGQAAGSAEDSDLRSYIRRIIDLAIQFNYLDDMYSQFVIASGRSKCLLADLASRLRLAQIAQPLASRLQQRAQQLEREGSTDLARSCLRKAQQIGAKRSSAPVGRSASSFNRPCSFIDTVYHCLGRGMHTGFVRAHQNAGIPEKGIEKLAGFAGHIGNFPRYYERVVRPLELAESTWYARHPTQGIRRAAAFAGQAFRGLWRGEDDEGEESAPQAAENGTGQKRAQKKWTSERMRKTAFVMGQTGRPLGEFADRMRSTTGNVTGFVARNRQDLLRIQALALMLDDYSLTDPRTRNLGDGKFRQLFDRLGYAFDHPRQVLRSIVQTQGILAELPRGTNDTLSTLVRNVVASAVLRHRRPHSSAKQ